MVFWEWHTQTHAPKSKQRKKLRGPSLVCHLLLDRSSFEVGPWDAGVMLVCLQLPGTSVAAPLQPELESFPHIFNAVGGCLKAG